MSNIPTDNERGLGIVFVYIAIGVVVSAYLAVKLEDQFRSNILLVISILSGCVSFVGCLTLVTLSWFWFSAEHKADLINRQLGTQYTREDVFYASGYIDEVRELQRNRIELNGDLITGDK